MGEGEGDQHHYNITSFKHILPKSILVYIANLYTLIHLLFCLKYS